MPPNRDQLLTVTDVLNVTGFKSRTTLYRRARSGAFPCRRSHERPAAHYGQSPADRVRGQPVSLGERLQFQAGLPMQPRRGRKALDIGFWDPMRDQLELF